MVQTTCYGHKCSAYSLALEQIGLFFQTPPATTDPTYVTKFTEDYSVMTWLLNSLEEKISGSVMFLITAKKMWDTLKVMYDNEKNPSRVRSMSACLSSNRETSVPEFYGELKGLIDG